MKINRRHTHYFLSHICWSGQIFAYTKSSVKASLDSLLLAENFGEFLESTRSGYLILLVLDDQIYAFFSMHLITHCLRL